MKNRGFTLVELLAVITILAIIVLITIPIMSNVTKVSKKEAMKRNIDLYGKAVEQAIKAKQLEKSTQKTTCSDYEEAIYNMKYNGSTVECDISIYNNGSIFMKECTVDGVEVKDYTYKYEQEDPICEVDFKVKNYITIKFEGFLRKYSIKTITRGTNFEFTFEDHPNKVTVIGVSNKEYIEGTDYTYSSETGKFIFNEIPESLTVRASGYSYCQQYIEAHQITNLKLSDCLKIADYGSYKVDGFNPSEEGILNIETNKGKAITNINSRKFNFENVEPNATYSEVLPTETKEYTHYFLKNLSYRFYYYEDNNLKISLDTETGNYNFPKAKTIDLKITELYDRMLNENNAITYYFCTNVPQCDVAIGIQDITSIADYDDQGDKKIKFNGVEFNVKVNSNFVHNVPGLYKAEDDSGDSYIYRGQLNNNWVKFGDLYYRIIRINGDGSIRMMLSGDSTNHIYTPKQLSSSGFYTTYGADSEPNIGHLCRFCSAANGYMRNNDISLVSRPNNNPDTTLIDGNNFLYYSDLTRDTEFYYFSNFNPERDCNIESGVCTLSGTLGNTVVYDTIENLQRNKLDGNRYTGEYKFSCLKYGQLLSDKDDPNIRVSCEIVREVVGVYPKIKNNIYIKNHGYTSSNNYSNLYDSLVKSRIDAWYSRTLLGTNLEEYITDEVFCGDRSTTNDGVAAPYNRIINKKKPSLKCPTKIDSYTVSNTKGNTDLTYSVGLVTVDELYYIGAYYNRINFKFWFNDYPTATMTPFGYNSVLETPYIAYLNSSGNMLATGPFSVFYYRPVINLKANVLFESGSGTEDSPYTVKLQ